MVVDALKNLEYHFKTLIQQPSYSIVKNHLVAVPGNESTIRLLPLNSALSHFGV